VGAAVTYVQDRIGRVTPRVMAIWIGLLMLGEADDIYTTAADLERGGIEGNERAQQLINLGGTHLLALVDFAVVLAIAIVAFLVLRQHSRDPSAQNRILLELVWRGIQLAVFVRLFQAAGNLFILTQLVS
jgi:hypothetical protein